MTSSTRAGLDLESTASSAFAADTLIPCDIDYQGYRVHVRDIRLLKQRRERYLLSVDVVNTGKRAVSFGPGFPSRLFQTDFDDALAHSGLLSLAGPLRAALLATAITLEPGEVAGEQKFWLEPGEASVRPVGRVDRIDTDNATPARRRASVAVTDTAVVRAVAARCGDLHVDGLKVLQRNKSQATIQVQLVNAGTAALDTTDIRAGGVLDLYVGGATRVTNASRRLGRLELSERISALGGGAGLAPGESLTIVQAIDLASVTKYNAVLVVQVDPGQRISECDETNNSASLVLID